MKIGKLLLALIFFTLPAKELSNSELSPTKNPLKRNRQIPVMLDRQTPGKPIIQTFPMPVIDPELLKIRQEMNKHRTEII